MTQLTIFQAIAQGQAGMNRAAARARHRDPHTSHHAASRVHEFAASHQSRILDCLKQHGPMGAEQIADKLGMAAYAVRKRLTEMQDAGACQPTGATRKTDSGRFERVWEPI